MIYGNNIEYLEGLDSMNNLKELLIHRNRIRSLNYLAMPNLQSLVKINASYNQLAQSELDNIAHVTLHLYNLKQLDLYGNDVFSSPAYKYRITENSSLEKLDGLDVKGVVKDRLDRLRKDWQVNYLIEETSEEAKKWIEAERELKGAALNILAKKQERITQEFESYKKTVDEQAFHFLFHFSDVLNFITYISDLKQQRNQGVSDKITFESLNNWRHNITYQENQRLDMLEDSLRQLEDKRKEEMEEVVTTTHFLDKLHEVSMQKPDIWNYMKNEEYKNSKLDQNRNTPKLPNQKLLSFQANNRGVDNMLKSGIRATGNRFKNDVQEENIVNKDDFTDQANRELQLKENFEKNSQYFSQSKRGKNMNQSGNLQPMSPQKYENDIGNPNNISYNRGQGNSFLEQFKSDPAPLNASINNKNQSIRQKQMPIPIEFQDPDNQTIAKASGNPVRQQPGQSGIRASQQPPQANKDAKSCLIF
ncbi:UNKNOWN [Stylonychia lemnae]|uniref:Uncharacterized protein n=1 Tax=Stylonychia lemnae TaxID=5949 RepID=A0A078AYS0_STYLE|nr:UNKNOWN [Stylonychia lemnae]|eukprot:CDW87281.1 UNKNOWN [Stylonychia lemnae]